MLLYLDTCIINYIVEKNPILNRAFQTDLKTSKIIFSAYSVFDIINQKGLDGYKDTVKYLKKNFDGFKIHISDSFKLSDKDFTGYNLSFNDFFEELSKPIIAELKRNIVNRLMVIWYYLQHIYSRLKAFQFDDITLRELISIVRSRLSVTIENELFKLKNSNSLQEKNIKKTYKNIRDIIRYNVWLSYINLDSKDSLFILSNIDFNLSCPTNIEENLLKLRISEMKKQIPALSNLSDEQIQNSAINVIKKNLDLGNIDKFEEKIIEFELRDIFINDDVFLANNYIDLFIMRMYLDYIKNHVSSTKRDSCYLITSDKDFLKRMKILYKEFNIQVLKDSINQSLLYFSQK